MTKQVQNLVGVPVSAETVAEVLDFLRDRKGSIGLGDFFQIGAAYLMENIESKPDDLLHVIGPETAVRGYMWKSLFLPEGTRVRMKYKGEWHYANVEKDEFMWEGEITSPSQFAIQVRPSCRNAWRDLYIKRPGDRTWILADTVRRQNELELDTLLAQH